MTSKKGAFANSATGYGKNKHHSHSHSHKSSQKSQKSAESVNKNIKSEEPPKLKPEELDSDLNSGFGNYLRSDDGVEMMKMFVFANTIMMIFTMAWPQIKEQYYWLREWMESFKESH